MSCPVVGVIRFRLNRRRSAGSRRSSFSAIGRGYATGEGVGFGDGDEDEDEGQAAEDDSVMFLSALRQDLW